MALLQQPGGTAKCPSGKGQRAELGMDFFFK